MSQKLPLNGFKLVEETFQFNESFIKAMIKKVMKDGLLKLMLNILKSYMTISMMFPF